MKFRVLIEEDIKKLVLKNGIPLTVEELVVAVKEAFSITENISLQYKDEDFLALTSTEELKDKATIKVVYPVINLYMTVVPDESTPDVSDVSSLCESTTHTVDSQDTVILSPSPTERQHPWP